MFPRIQFSETGDWCYIVDDRSDEQRLTLSASAKVGELHLSVNGQVIALSEEQWDSIVGAAAEMLELARSK
jgi:hypothetical protein